MAKGRVQRETGKQEVTFLESVDISDGYVSIVTRGANQLPFKIVKVQEPVKKEDEMKKKLGDRVVRTLIAPKGTEPDLLHKVFGEDIKLEDKIESTTSDIYPQLDPDMFDADCKLFKIEHGEQSFGVVAGALKEQDESGRTLMTAIRERVHQKAAPVSVLQVPGDCEPVEDETVLKEMSWELYDEVSALSSGIYAILSQKAGSADEKLTMLQTMWGNFEAFCAETFATMQEKAAEPILGRPDPEPDADSVVKVDTVEQDDVAPEDSDEGGVVIDKQDDDVPAQSGGDDIPEDELLSAVSARLEKLEEAITSVAAFGSVITALSESVTKLQGDVETFQKDGVPPYIPHSSDPPGVTKPTADVEKSQGSKYFGPDLILRNMSIYQPVSK